MRTSLIRLLREWRRRHDAHEIDAAVASLRVDWDGDVAVVSRERGAPLDESTLRATMLRLEPSVYGATPTSTARVTLLSIAAKTAPRVDVHAPTLTEGTHRGRIAIDLVRRAMRALHLPAAEPGDRFDGGFRHAFFDEESLVEEAERAGLRVVSREGDWLRLERGPRATEDLAPFVSEVARALAVVGRAERLRRSASPERAVATMRADGRRERARGIVGRARLRRAIGWVDAVFPTGPNCFRRVLLEIGLDGAAANETLVFGLDVGKTGHVAFKDSEQRSFDVAFEIGA
jgi:hypothetical protein